MNEPVALETKPARKIERYNGFTITVEFDLGSGRWNWTAVRPVTTQIKIDGTAGSPALAIAAAKRKVDRL